MPQQPGLHKIKTNTKRRESSKETSRRKIIDSKGKDDLIDAQDPEADIDEEYNRLIDRQYKRILNEYEPYSSPSDYDSDRSLMGPW